LGLAKKGSAKILHGPTFFSKLKRGLKLRKGGRGRRVFLAPLSLDSPKKGAANTRSQRSTNCRPQKKETAGKGDEQAVGHRMHHGTSENLVGEREDLACGDKNNRERQSREKRGKGKESTDMVAHNAINWRAIP